MATESERVMRELVEERAELVRSFQSGELTHAVGGGRPLSRDQHVAGGVAALNTEAFVKAIT